MKAFKGLHFLVAGIACMATGYLVPTSFSALLYIASMVLVVLSIRRANMEANVRAVKQALQPLDQLFLGKRYIGLQSQAVHTTQLEAVSAPGYWGFRQLCRTARGAWFLIEFETKHGSGKAVNTRIVDVVEDAVAREYLLRASESAYQSVFGTLPDCQVA